MIFYIGVVEVYRSEVNYDGRTGDVSMSAVGSVSFIMSHYIRQRAPLVLVTEQDCKRRMKYAVQCTWFAFTAALFHHSSMIIVICQLVPCLSVSVYVCENDNSESSGRIRMKIFRVELALDKDEVTKNLSILDTHQFGRLLLGTGIGIVLELEHQVLALNCTGTCNKALVAKTIPTGFIPFLTDSVLTYE